MWDYSGHGRGLLIFGTYFLLNFPGALPLSCYTCEEGGKDPDRCNSKVGDVSACGPSAKYCIVSTGFRVVEDKTYPALTRRCTTIYQAETDSKIFAIATANGLKMVCILVVRKENYRLPPDFVDRRCVCAENNCNNKLWDDVVVLPYIQANFSEGNKPVIPTSPGKESLENIKKVLGITPGEKPTLTSDTTEDPDESSVQSTAVRVAQTSGTGATDSSRIATKSSTSDEAGGSKTGLIAGAAVGGLSLLGLLSGLLYWFLVLRKRKKKRKSSDESGDSANSADTDASGEDNE